MSKKTQKKDAAAGKPAEAKTPEEPLLRVRVLKQGMRFRTVVAAWGAELRMTQEEATAMEKQGLVEVIGL